MALPKQAKHDRSATAKKSTSSSSQQKSQSVKEKEHKEDSAHEKQAAEIRRDREVDAQHVMGGKDGKTSRSPKSHDKEEEE